MACPGDIIRIGQRDLRQAHKTENDWYVAEKDGTLREIDQVEARKLFAKR